MAKNPINEYPLIAITDILDMESNDAICYGFNGTVEDLLERKWEHIVDTHAKTHYKGWNSPDWAQTDPVYFSGGVFYNGHHRVAKLHSQGVLFVHYTNDYSEGWD